jgi:hypothetical protein
MVSSKTQSLSICSRVLHKKNPGILLEIQRWQQPTYLFVVIINRILVMKINVVHADDVESTCMLFGTGVGLHLLLLQQKKPKSSSECKNKVEIGLHLSGVPRMLIKANKLHFDPLSFVFLMQSIISWSSSSGLLLPFAAEEK